jgi:hypothetical protein
MKMVICVYHFYTDVIVFFTAHLHARPVIRLQRFVLHNFEMIIAKVSSFVCAATGKNDFASHKFIRGKSVCHF